MKRRFEELGIQLYNPVERMVAMRQITEQRAMSRLAASAGG